MGIDLSDENSREYYAARAITARQMSTNASDKHIARIHEEMADRYDQLARYAAPRRNKLSTIFR